MNRRNRNRVECLEPTFPLSSDTMLEGGTLRRGQNENSRLQNTQSGSFCVFYTYL